VIDSGLRGVFDDVELSVSPERGGPPLSVLVFVVGAGSLGAEIAAVRLLAPYFGASTVVWANTIGVVLVALSVGYWLGGRLADRRPRMQGLYTLSLVAASLLAAVPFVARPLLDHGVTALDRISAGAFLGSLLATLLLVAAPVLLLGAVSPWALRMAVKSVRESGTVAGRLYAVSTAGSLVGTLLSAMVLIPALGTRRTFLAFALPIAAVAVWGLLPLRRYLVVPVAILALALLPAGTIRSVSHGRLLYEAETPYQYARVIEDGDGTRRLELNEGLAVHSLYKPDSVLTGDYWDGYLVLPFARDHPRLDRVAVLGNAAGTITRAYERFFPRTRIDGVEIDGELSDIGRRFFGMDNPRLRVFAEDARPFLRRSAARYDMIALDAYRQPYIPFYLTTKEFFELAREHLAPGGLVVVNVGHPSGQDALERALSATLMAVFGHVARDPIEPTNTLLLASQAPITGGAINQNLASLPAGLRALASRESQNVGAPLAGGPIYTDDRAPVEWLIDRSIVKYAAGARGDGRP
jgi:spermidine synthase